MILNRQESQYKVTLFNPTIQEKVLVDHEEKTDSIPVSVKGYLILHFTIAKSFSSSNPRITLACKSEMSSAGRIFSLESEVLCHNSLHRGNKVPMSRTDKSHRNICRYCLERLSL